MSLKRTSAMKLSVALAAVIAWCQPIDARADTKNPNTDWFKEAGYGVFMHFLPGDTQGLARVKDFDVDVLAGQLEAMGAKYFVLTLGQNSGFMNSPNPVYERVTGYAPGERCSTRDLPLDLYRVLKPKGVKLMLYLPCQAPNRDARAQEAFGLPQGAKDQPITIEFAKKWAQVIQEWSDRYGDKVAGWWFDGGYEWIGFNNDIARIYAAAVKHGNPDAIVTFNPGVSLIRWTQAEDYTAGELTTPFDFVPTSRWVDGSQWHALTYLGSRWGARDTRYSNEQWAAWMNAVRAKAGVITLDMGPNYDPGAGPVGSFAEEQVKQVQAIKTKLDAVSANTHPTRLKRADSFFGLHFDFHAGTDCTEIGKNTTREMIERVIGQVRPDYIQIDCKGHPGLSSYPTKVGNPAPGFVGDPLRLWREVTAEHGVALYMHYSGVWDSEAIRRHPDWAVVNADGSRNKNATSFFGPYADQLLIPQLRELAGDYGVDGAWVDGECWASQPDYGDAAVKAFAEATGIDTVPRKPGEPHWYEFLQFNREAFRNYLRYYIDQVKKTHPQMQLCSNWAFTDHMPEAVCAPIDWISGDYSPEDSVNSARLSARYLAHQGKPWDLMAWSFATRGPTKNRARQKSAVQLQREAAVVLALGGGFQFYHTQRRDGSIREENLPVMAEVAKFCRERQAICHQAVPVPQVALLYSTASHYREINGLFNRDLSRISGTLQALLESQLSVDVVSEHHLAGRMADYPLIVVAECDYLEPAFKQDLMDYVKDGGNLFIVGPAAASLFASELGVTLEGTQLQARYLIHEGRACAAQGTAQTAILESQTRAFDQLYVAGDAGPVGQPAASIKPLGKGKVAATYFSFSRGYLATRSPQLRVFLSDLVRQLFPKPLVEVAGSSDVDVSISRLKDQLTVHLVNTSGAHWDRENPLCDSIAPVGPLQVTIREQNKPAKIMLEPGGRAMAFEYRDGEIHLTVPSLEIHSVIVVQ